MKCKGDSYVAELLLQLPYLQCGEIRGQGVSLNPEDVLVKGARPDEIPATEVAGICLGCLVPQVDSPARSGSTRP